MYTDGVIKRGRQKVLVAKRMWTLAAALLLQLSWAGQASAESMPVVPPGFQVDLYASKLHLPTALAFGPDSRLFVSQEDGSILAIGGHRIVRLASVHGVPLGLAWYRRTLYVS